MVKNNAKETALTYSNCEAIHVSKFLCPKSIVLFITKICHLDLLQNTTSIILMPQNHLDKLWFTFSKEMIVKFQYFFSKIYKIINIQFQRMICSIILPQKYAIYTLLIGATFHENPKPVTLSFLTSYGCRSVYLN